MGKTVYLGNLGRDITKNRLQELLEAHGKVVDVRVITDHYTGLPRGFAFVDMATEDEASRAISGLDGVALDGQPLKVAEARPRRQPDLDRSYYSSYRY